MGVPGCWSARELGVVSVTKYQILAREGDTVNWTIQDEVEAANVDAAIRDWYMRYTPVNVTAVVAVPSRSWKPTPIRTETKTRVVLGDEPEAEPAQPQDES